MRRARVSAVLAPVPRGLQADHTTLWRWVQRYGPGLKAQRRRPRTPDQTSWRVDGARAGAPLHGRAVAAGGQLLTGSSFAVTRETRQGGTLSFWSRWAQSSFAGRAGALGLDGDVRTTLGIEHLCCATGPGGYG